MGTPAPTPCQWKQVWKLWDAATLVMVPPERHCDRPLELRQPFIFYLGHLPAFTDARLAKVLQQQLSKPAYYADMFARGIDPDLDDPTQCHSHSPTPAAWPPLDDILAYRDKVRTRILQLYGSANRRSASAAAAADAPAPCKTELCRNGATTAHQAAAAVVAAMPAELQHVLWMCHQHEAMHLETLLYLLVQYEAVQPPPADLVAAVPAAAWRSDLAAACYTAAAISAFTGRQCSLSDRYSTASKSSRASSLVDDKTGGSAALRAAFVLPQPPAAAWVDVPTCQVTLGFDAGPSSSSSSSNNSSTDTDRTHGAEQNGSGSSSSSSGGSRPMRFGWDNECPARPVSVSGFQLQQRPVTVLEYLRFMACTLAGGTQAQKVAAAAAAAAGSGSGIGSAAAAPAGAQDDSSVTCSTDTPLGLCQQQHYEDGMEGGWTSTSKWLCGHHIWSRSWGCSTTGSSSNSSTLPEVLSSFQGRHPMQSLPPPCASCRHVLQQLLQKNTAVGLLPASLALPAAAATNSADAGSHCRSDCSMLCQLMTSSGSSSTPGSGSKLSTLEAVLFHSLQLHIKVKTVFGLAPISIAGYWPVYCSAVQAEQYAGWLSSKVCSSNSSSSSFRLPTEAELLAARQHTGSRQQDSCASKQVQGVNFAAWHPLCVQLQSDVVHAKPHIHSNNRRDAAVDGSPLSTTDCGSSSGSASTSCCQGVSQLCDNGWEWTSSTFNGHEGFEAHPLYPEYSQDFFGGKHVVLLGGSWATLNSIAGRSTFRNWYQKGQQHVFAKFRLVSAE